MYTILMEVINNNIPWQGFYNPVIPECKKGFRSEERAAEAIKNMTKFAYKTDWIKAFKFKVYQGQWEHYKNCPLIVETEAIYKEAV